MSLFFFRSQGWMRRAALPFGFALAVTAGSTVLMRAAIFTGDAPAPQPVAQVVLPPPAEAAPDTHGGHPAPTYVRAIESDAVYTPPKIEKAVVNHKVDEAARKPTVAALPQGVERFDRCTDDCDSRDPLIERSNYTEATTATAAAPTYQVVDAPESQESNALFSLPKWEDGVEMIDKAKAAVVSAGSEAAGTLKKAVDGASDFATGLVRPGSASVQ
ncbi:hypothetical protein LGR54_20415 [Ancylobacter sp. Lp-2]|uniref:hypothetical protein n=1 Tax=Ancylobacter sp. Lp-2 TaxID=2881339 RepID=UPI001E65D17B|nr:hypothetical protein [Ancylobacter sp. Lp-2]MCB4770977.1 hypothetical protein [Ancylobacter sp. Lp-2]